MNTLMADAASKILNIEGMITTTLEFDHESVYLLQWQMLCQSFKIEGMIVTFLESDHETVHLLCESHTVKKLGASNLNASCSSARMTCALVASRVDNFAKSASSVPNYSSPTWNRVLSAWC